MVLAKPLLLSFWTWGYGICFAVTYGYHAYFWDNGVARSLFFSAAVWWLFGVWVICLLVLFSTLLGNHTGVILCTGGTVLLAYVLRIIPGGGAYSPVVLTDAGALLSGFFCGSNWGNGIESQNCRISFS